MKEALKLALEALEFAKEGKTGWTFLLLEAITAIKQALAAPVQEPVCIYPRCSCNSKDFCDPKRQQALDKKAENARELGLDYEPAPVQEPVAYVATMEVHGQMCSFIHRIDLTKLLPDGAKLYTTPPAAQRQWVGLNEENFSAINQSCLTKLQAATSAESILMRKNT